MTAQPYTIDELIEHLNAFWEKATGLAYGQEHEVMHCAAKELETLTKEHELMRQTLQTIAGGASDGLQRTQALGALANIGPRPTKPD